MHDKSLNIRQLEKARSHPLNVHCRQVLKLAGQELSEQALGAPELMEWTLKQGKLSIALQHWPQLQELVQLIKDKPTLTLALLDNRTEGEDCSLADALCAERDPYRLGEQLLQRLNMQMKHTSDQY